jgi:hypothetical protein
MLTKISWFLNLSKKELVNLQELDLSEEDLSVLTNLSCTKFNVFCKHLLMCSKLQRLNLSRVNLDFLNNDNFKQLCYALAELKNLQQLNLSNNNIGCLNRVNISCLSASIAKLSELIELNLGGNSLAILDYGNFIILLNSIRHCFKLNTLMLNSNKFALLQKEKIIVLREVLDSLNNLRVLNLRRNDLGSLSNELFSEFCWLLSGLQHLYQLDLSSNKLDLLNEFMFSSLCNVLLSCNNLQSLILGMNSLHGIAKNNFLALCSSVLRHDNLRELQLKVNQLVGLNISNFIYLCVMLQKMRVINLNKNGLGYLDNNQFVAFCNLLKNNKQLEKLYLARNGLFKLSIDKIKVLFDCLIEAGACTVLDLSNNIIIWSELNGYYVLCARIFKIANLQEFYLNDSDLVELGFDKLQLLVNAFKLSPKLQEVYLQGNNFNKLSDYDLLKLCENLASCKLKLIDLTNNNFTIRKLELIKKCFELISIKSLEHVRYNNKKARSVLLGWQHYRNQNSRKKIKNKTNGVMDVFNLTKKFSRLNLHEKQKNNNFGDNFSVLTSDLVEIVLEYCDLITTDSDGSKSQPKLFKLDLKL